MNKLVQKSNIRHLSIRKKTASRICSTQILYGVCFLNFDINQMIKSYLDNYLIFVLKDLSITEIDNDLFHNITHGVINNIEEIDKIISKNLATDWSLERLSLTEKTILRLSTYELCFDKRFKKLTIINEYISIIDVFGGNPDFANGILESISN